MSPDITKWAKILAIESGRSFAAMVEHLLEQGIQAVEAEAILSQRQDLSASIKARIEREKETDR